MAKQDTLERVEKDIARGDLGRARDRLHGLLTAYPQDLDLRKRLGKVYWRLQHPGMAGRYWYLEEKRTPEMDEAVAAFERECGKDARTILSRVRFRGDASSLPTYAREKLAMLEEARRRATPPGAQSVVAVRQRTQGSRRQGWASEAPLMPAEGARGAWAAWEGGRVRQGRVSGRRVVFGCLLFLLLFFVAVVLGFTTLVRWMVNLLT